MHVFYSHTQVERHMPQKAVLCLSLHTVDVLQHLSDPEMNSDTFSPLFSSVTTDLMLDSLE